MIKKLKFLNIGKGGGVIFYAFQLIKWAARIDLSVLLQQVAKMWVDIILKLFPLGFVTLSWLVGRVLCPSPPLHSLLVDSS